MADASIFSDVSQCMLETLRRHLCPDPIPSPHQIAVASPTQQDRDYLLGVDLYDIQEEGECSQPGFVSLGSTRMRRTPSSYCLYYMIYFNPTAQMSMNPLDCQKILGRVAQMIHDTPPVFPTQLQPWLEQEEPSIVWVPSKLTWEEKTKIWTAMQKPYQLSLFYQAFPVLLSSAVTIDPPRVTQAEFSIRTKED